MFDVVFFLPIHIVKQVFNGPINKNKQRSIVTLDDEEFQKNKITQNWFGWKCANGPDHEWKAEVRSRFKIGKNKNIEITKCPYCAGNRKKVNRVLDALNDFGQMRDEFEMDYDSLSFGSVDLDVFVG